MNNQYKSDAEKLFPYAVVGYLVTKWGMSPERIDSLTPFEILMYTDEFKRFIKGGN